LGGARHLDRERSKDLSEAARVEGGCCDNVNPSLLFYSKLNSRYRRSYWLSVLLDEAFKYSGNLSVVVANLLHALLLVWVEE